MGGFGYNQSESQQQSGLRGTGYEGAAAGQAYKTGARNTSYVDQLMSSPGAMLNFGRQMLPGGKYGLGENVDRGVEALGDYSFSKASASGAQRGQTSPQNIQGILGSTIQNMLPFLIPQLQGHQAAQFSAPAGLFDIANRNADYWSRVLGGSSSGSSFGFGANVAAPKGW